MSEPKRYEPDHEGLMYPTPKGNYVLMQDYALLKAAFDLLDESIKLGPSTMPVSRGYYFWKESEQYFLKEENARLKAKIVRLTEAGDNLAADIGNSERSQYMCADAWRAAKEDKPHA